MERRTFLHLRPSTKNRPTEVLQVAGTSNTAGLEPYTGPWGIPQVTHLLRRTLFGAKWEDVQFLLTMTPDQAVKHLLTPSEAPPPPVNDYNGEDGFVDPDVPPGEPWINAPHNNAAEGHRIWTLKCWWYGNLIEQERSIVEKMTLFWHNHIPVEFWGVFFGRWNYRYLETLRRRARRELRPRATGALLHW